MNGRRPIGNIRPSQMISAFGPGSLVQLEHDSVIITGIDGWERAQDYKVLHHPVLEVMLKKSHFRMPRQSTESPVVTCKSFPRWGVCPECSRLQWHQDMPSGAFFKCSWRCDKKLYPADFVIMCDRGHLDEFPWWEWAHSKSEVICDDSRKELRLRQLGRRLGLADYSVSCDLCGSYRDCGDIAVPSALKSVVPSCRGRQPWLGREESCNAGDTVRGIQTSSHSLYYSSTVSALSIKEWLHPLQTIIAENMQGIEALINANAGFTASSIAEQPMFEEARRRYRAEEIAEHIETRQKIVGRFGDDSTELDIREVEYEHLRIAHGKDEHLEAAPVDLTPYLEKYLDGLKMIKRITEIRVLRAFTRGQAPDPYSPAGGDVHFCPIARGGTDWYPAVENRGEGIMFSLNEGRLRQWEQMDAVQSRCGGIIRPFKQWLNGRSWPDQEISPRRILLHTISHVVIRGLANISGYGEASIRERLYIGDNYAGGLIYTASPSADGSLGGLVRQGSAENFEDILRSAVARSMHCSRDPLCIEDDPLKKEEAGFALHTRLNGSACYGCTLLPETSCENINYLLDRRLLFGDIGFFEDD